MIGFGHRLTNQALRGSLKDIWAFDGQKLVTDPGRVAGWTNARERNIR